VRSGGLESGTVRAFGPVWFAAAWLDWQWCGRERMAGVGWGLVGFGPKGRYG
jgi:hypothetical protein